MAGLLDFLRGQSESEPFDPYGEGNDAPDAKARGQAVMAAQSQPRKGISQGELASFVDALLANKLQGQTNNPDLAGTWNGWKDFRPSDNVEVRPHQDYDPKGRKAGDQRDYLRQAIPFPTFGGAQQAQYDGLPGMDLLLSGQNVAGPYDFSDRDMNDTRGTPINTGSPRSIEDLVRMIALDKALNGRGS